MLPVGHITTKRTRLQRRSRESIQSWLLFSLNDVRHSKLKSKKAPETAGYHAQGLRV